ncbi:hypothetical protein GMD78_09950 [Ornithinibacillus sp. L9]|uniref:ABC-2 family transporter protein n=1 Tax=Ornithinibacillus caprae TaxID=2678566 RepID=A0A6N8FK66_9BACI|nr:hypothetical protein [Ornithinibacillus caprae]MUK88714.1 hypothetical protein [Ornithinibacillus caprae]
MNTWKQAFKLATFELKQSKINLIFSLVITLFLLGYLRKSLPEYVENGFLGFDLFFMILFSFATAMPKPKAFQIQNIQPNFIVSPILLMQKHLPIKEEVLIKSRFIIHFIYTFPFQVIAIVGLLYLATFPAHFSIDSMIAFAILWLSFSFYVGFIFPASDTGDKGFLATTAGLFIIGILTVGIGSILFTLFHAITGHGFVYWSIIAADKWPLFTSIASIIAAYSGYHFWKNYMKRNMNKIDYI